MLAALHTKRITGKHQVGYWQNDPWNGGVWGAGRGCVKDNIVADENKWINKKYCGKYQNLLQQQQGWGRGRPYSRRQFAPRVVKQSTFPITTTQRTHDAIITSKRRRDVVLRMASLLRHVPARK